MPVNFRWTAGVPTTEWSVGFETLEISQLSTQYVVVPVAASKAGAAYNPTADIVQFAFSPSPTHVPATADWVNGSWDTVPTSPLYPYNAKCLIGPTGATVLTSGSYNIYLKITDNPEVPVLVTGTLQIF